MEAYINRITVKKDGVYLSLRSKEAKNYRSTRIPTLSTIYEKEGQAGLDREITTFSKSGR